MNLAAKLINEATKTKAGIEFNYKGKTLKISFPNDFQMDVYYDGKEVGRFDSVDAQSDIERAKNFTDDCMKTK